MKSKWKWVEDFLNNEAPAYQKFKGYYNNNYVVERMGKKFLVRTPICDAKTMDLRLIPEQVVLKWLEGQDIIEAPQILYQHPDNLYSVHSFIEGKTLSHVYPREERFPDWIAKVTAKKMQQLHSLEYPLSFVEYCKDMLRPTQNPNDSEYFFTKKIDFVEHLFYQLQKRYGDYYDKMGIPEDAFCIPRSNQEYLTARPFVFTHCDLHRKNLIIQSPIIQEHQKKEKNNLVILDWELCLIGDAYHDLAIHLHKMRYEPHQEQIFLEHYLNAKKNDKIYKNALKEIKYYEQLEIIRTVIVDIQRADLDYQTSQSKKERKIIASHYYNKLKKSFEIFNNSNQYENIKIKDILHILDELERLNH